MGVMETLIGLSPYGWLQKKRSIKSNFKIKGVIFELIVESNTYQLYG